jgi:hypothetical protein
MCNLIKIGKCFENQQMEIWIQCTMNANINSLINVYYRNLKKSLSSKPLQNKTTKSKWLSFLHIPHWKELLNCNTWGDCQHKEMVGVAIGNLLHQGGIPNMIAQTHKAQT